MMLERSPEPDMMPWEQLPVEVRAKPDSVNAGKVGLFRAGVVVHAVVPAPETCSILHLGQVERIIQSNTGSQSVRECMVPSKPRGGRSPGQYSVEVVIAGTQDCPSRVVSVPYKLVISDPQPVHAVEQSQSKHIPVGQVVRQPHVQVPECIVPANLVPSCAVLTVYICDGRYGDGIHPCSPQAELERSLAPHQRPLVLQAAVDQTQRKSPVIFIQVAVTRGDIHHR